MPTELAAGTRFLLGVVLLAAGSSTPAASTPPSDIVAGATALKPIHQAAQALVLAAEIPESVHREYLMGARSVRLATDPTSIPFSGTDWFGHYRSPYVQVFVNGRGPFTFLFDTGSNVTIFSTKVVKAASVAVISHVAGHHAVARANDVRVGSVSMRDYYAVVADGDDVDGILGFNSFGQNYLTFDFSSKVLLVSKRPVPMPFAFWLPYALKKHLPLIDLFADSRRLPTLIDTGDDAYGWEGTSEDLKGLLFDHPPVPSATVFNGQTGATKTLITSIDGSLVLGQVHSERPAVAINESLPLPDIGIDVIDQFTVEFDRIHHRVAFQPYFSGSEFVVPGEFTYGFYISFRHPERRVRDVLPDLAPARANMRAGDLIMDINGLRAASVSYESWDRLLRGRQPVTVVWDRNGHVLSRNFRVVELR
ncbi:MAG: aspartyl protease family protein [Candidatus Cybelea sp.]